MATNAVEKKEREQMLKNEQAKGNKKGGKNQSKPFWSFKGFGNIDEAKGNYQETGKHAGIMALSGLGGGAVGVALGKSALLVGLATTVVSTFMGSNAGAVAGVGMMLGSFSANNLTPEQQAQLNKENPLKEGEAFSMEREQARAGFALNNALATLKSNLFLTGKKEDKKEPPKDENANKEQPKTGTQQGVSGYKRGFGSVSTTSVGIDIF